MDTATKTGSFTKVMRPGMIPPYEGAHPVSIFCKVTYTEDGRLSFGGVIGPKANGNAAGGAGQIDMEFAHRNPADNDDRYSHLFSPEEITFTPGWDEDLWLDFLDAWKNWHLNDMHAYCEHQAALGWRERAREKITLYHWRTTKFVSDRVRQAEKEATAALRAGKTVQHPQEILDLIVLPPDVTTGSAEPPSGYYEPNGPRYTGDSFNRPSEEKLAGWVRPNEHPDGLLTAPCPVCGYGYGTAWKKEAVPAEILDFLRGLPETDRTPAWV